MLELLVYLGQGKRFRIKRFPQPFHRALMFLVVGIGQDFEHVGITPRAAAVFGRTSPGAFEAARVFTFGFEGEKLFHDEFMFPSVAEVVGVMKRGAGFGQHPVQERDSRIVGRRVFQLHLHHLAWHRIAFGAQPEFVQVRVFPAHDDLHRQTQIGQGGVAANLKASPHRRLHFEQGDFDLQCLGILHRSNLRASSLGRFFLGRHNSVAFGVLNDEHQHARNYAQPSRRSNAQIGTAKRPKANSVFHT